MGIRGVPPTAARAWARGSGVAERAVRLSHSDTASARSYLEQSLATNYRGFSEATTSVLHGLVAARTGDHRSAVELYTRIDSIPLILESYSSTWGIRALSFMLRGDSYAALGDTASALRYYERFIEDWSNADSLAVVHVERVRGEVGRIRGERSR